MPYKVKQMILIDDERPSDLMKALAEVRDIARCNMLDFSCVVNTLKSIGCFEVAYWLERHQESYTDIVIDEFSEWLNTHPTHLRISLAQQVANATGLEVIED